MAGLQIVSTGLLFGTGLCTTTGLTSGGGLQVSAALSGAAQLLANETQGLAIDFTDLSMVIKDTGTPANAFSGDPNSKLTYASPSTKWILGANGLYSSGTTLRTSYNASGVALGVLIEAARTNLVLRSAMGNALGSWNGNLSTRTLSSAVDPFGTQNAMNVVTTGNAGLNVSQAVSVSNGTQYTASCFVKGAAGQQIFFGADGTAAGQVLVTFTGAWQRVSATVTTASTVAYVNFERFNRSGGAHLPDVTFDCTGMQLELGSLATSPIVTAASTVTRAVDNITLSTTAFPFSWPLSSYVQGVGRNGAAFWETNDVKIAMYQSTGLHSALSGGATAGYTYVPMLGGVEKIAARWNTNDTNIYAGGVNGGADVAVSAPTATWTSIRLGFEIGGGVALSNYIKSLMIIPRAMSNAELQAITT